ncbi:MAG: hypothetical protein RQ862_02330 [Candidatus Caldarchaeales archaeon]|jgi:hypothetical protein|nr:hypothetical protein [Candidatus Caldarchaeales archaeon]
MKVVFLAKQSQRPSFEGDLDRAFEEEKIRRKREQLEDAKSHIEVWTSFITNDWEELKSILEDIVDFVNKLPDPATVTEEDAAWLGDQAYRLIDRLDSWRNTFNDRCDEIFDILSNIANYVLPPGEMPWPKEEEKKKS